MKGCVLVIVLIASLCVLPNSALAASPTAAPHPLTSAPPAASSIARVSDAEASATTGMESPAEKEVDQSIDSVLGDHAGYRKTYEGFKAAVAAHDAKTAAEYVRFPMTVKVKGKKLALKSSRDFIAEYDQFMTPAITSALLKSRYGDLFVNYQGIMVGDGQVWINGICKDAKCAEHDVRVITIQAAAK